MWSDRETKSFYNSSNWKRKRIEILIRDHFECVDCRKRVTTTPLTKLHGWQKRIHVAKQVHHIIELKERPDLALENDNLVSLCIMCHNIRHGRDPFKMAKEKKTTWDELW